MAQPGQDGSMPGSMEDDDGGVPGPGADAAAQLACQQTCSDTNSCTTDRCTRAGACVHQLDARNCDGGASCHPVNGCTPAKACTMASDCADSDECTVNERCDQQSDTCRFSPLDGDRDGFPPASCGGTDCNDGDRAVNPGRTEACNNKDDNCNGTVDENAFCPGDQVCNAGKCACPAGTMACGQSSCADLMTDARHCGQCGNNCGPAGVCQAGKCTCPAGNTMCGDQCVDTKTSFQHCGGCGTACDFNPPEACMGGACTACGSEVGQPCCQIQGMGYCIGEIPMADGPTCDQTTKLCVAAP